MSKALILIDYINDICHEKGNPASCAGRNPEFHEVSLRMLASFANIINVLDLVVG